jgi:hypothetical protein
MQSREDRERERERGEEGGVKVGGNRDDRDGGRREQTGVGRHGDMMVKRDEIEQENRF